MANKPQGPQNQEAQAAAVDRCPVDGCKKPMQRMHFCSEHFVWYKEGLLNKKGQKPTDFDKKYQNFARKKAA